MPDMNDFLKNAVGNDLYNQWMTASQMDASKYIPFDNSYGWNDFWSPGAKYSKDRVSNWISAVMDRQYEMDRTQQEIDLQNSAYQRAVDDMKKSGINPYWINSLTGAGSSISSANQAENPNALKSGDKSYDLSKTILKLATSALMVLMIAG